MNEHPEVTTDSTDDVSIARVMFRDAFGYPMIFEGSAKRNPIDAPNRQVGADLALWRALREASRFYRRRGYGALNE